MIEMELDQTLRWSPTTSPRCAENRSSRDRRKMDGSASPGKDFDAKKHRIAKYKCRPTHHELEGGDEPRQNKRARHSDHHDDEHFKDSLEERHHVTNSKVNEKHEPLKGRRSSPWYGLSKGKCQNNFMSKHMKDELRAVNYHGRDTRASLGCRESHQDTSGPLRYSDEGHRQKVKGYNSSPQAKAHDRTNRSGDHKDDCDVERNNSLSRNCSLPRAEAHRSSKWRANDDRQVDRLDRQTSSSWNEPKLGEETASRDAPNSCKGNSENVTCAHNTRTDNTLPSTGPKWGDETNEKDASHPCKSSATKWDPWEANSSSSWKGPKWGDRADTKGAPGSSQWRSDADKLVSTVSNVKITQKDAPHPCKSSTTKCDPWEANNSSSWKGPEWGDRADTKDAPGSSLWRSDADKLVSNVFNVKINQKDAPDSCKSSTTKCDPWEANNSSPWKDPKLGDRANTKDAPGSSQWRSDADKLVSNVKTDVSSAWNGQKCRGETNTKFAADSSLWKSVADNNLGSNVGTDKSLLHADSKWGGRVDFKNAPMLCSSGAKWDSKETNRNSPSNGPGGDDGATIKGAPGACQWRSAIDGWGSKATTSNSSRNIPKWGDETVIDDGQKSGDKTNAKVVPRPRRSSNTDWNPWETKNSTSCNGPNLDDRETAREVPDSSHWRSDVDKWGSNVKIDNCTSWTGSKWGDKTNVNDAPCSRRSSNTDWDPWETKNSSLQNGSKQDDRTTTKDASGSLKYRSDVEKQNSYVKTGSRSSWAGSQWGDKTNGKDTSRSRRSNTDQDPWESRNSLSRNGPKQHDRATINDEPGSLQRRSSDVEKQSSYMKTDSRSSWSGLKWDDKTNVKDTLCLRRSSNTDWDPWQTKDTSSPSGPNQNDRITSTDAPDCLQRRSDVENRDSNVKTDNCSSWTGSKWNDKTDVKDASCMRTSNTVWDPWETKKGSFRNGPQQNDRATTKDAPSSLQPKSDVGEWRSQVKTDIYSSRTSLKGRDKTNARDASPSRRLSNTYRDPHETNNSSSRNGVNRDDKATTKDAPGSSQRRSDVDKWGSNVKTDVPLSWTGSKWSDKTNVKDISRSRRSSDTDWDPWETKNSSSQNGPNQEDKAITNATPNSSQWRTVVDGWGSNVKTSNCSSRPDLKWGDKPNVMDAPCSKRPSNTDWDPWENKNSSSQIGFSCDDRAATKEFPTSLQWRSDADKCGSDVKTNNCSSWDGPKWGNEANAKDVPSSSGWTSGDRWKGSKWSDQTAARSVLDSSGYRLDNEKQANNVESQKKSWDGPEFEDAQKLHRQKSGGGERDCRPKFNNDTGRQTCTKGVPNSHRGYSSRERKQTGVQTNSRLSENGAKWGDQTSAGHVEETSCFRSYDVQRDCSTETDKFSSWKGLKWDDRAPTKGVQNSFTRRAEDADSHINEETKKCSSWSDKKWVDIDAEDPNLEANPKWSDQRATKETLYRRSSNADKHDYGMKTEKSSWNDVQCKNQSNIKDATRTDDDRRDHNAKPTDNFSLDAPKLKNLQPAVISPNDFQQRSDDQKKYGDHAFTMEARKTSGNVEAIGQQTGQEMKEQTDWPHHNAECDTRTAEEINIEDEKGIQMFKFALVAFVKDILKPFWKQGHLSKEAHKTIVKKVVDKVVGALQGIGIPKTQRNIDIYMDYSKAKLTNLVQAYLERYATACASVHTSDSVFCMNMVSEEKMSAQSSAT